MSMVTGQCFPDSNSNDVVTIVGWLQSTKTGNVINNRAVARSGDSFYVEKCKRRLDLWNAARLLARAFR